MWRVIKKAKNKFFQLPRYMRVITYVVLVYLCYLWLICHYVPGVVKQDFSAELSSYLGRKVSVGAVKINPFSGQIRVNDLSLAGLSDKQPLLTIQSLQGDIRLWKSFFTWTPTISHFSVHSPHLYIARFSLLKGDEHYNFSDIIQHIKNHTATQHALTNNAKPQGFPFKAENIAVKDGKLIYQDYIQHARFAYQDISLSIYNFDADALLSAKVQKANKVPNQISFSVHKKARQSFAFNGRLQLFPLQVNGNYLLDHLNLPDLWPYLRRYFPVQLRHGSLSAAGHVMLVTQKQPRLNLTEGRVSITNLQLEHADESHLRIKALHIDGIAADVTKRNMVIDHITLAGVKLQSRYTRQGADIRQFATMLQQQQSAAATASNWLVRVKSLTANASIRMKDDGLANNVVWQMNPVRVQLDDIYSDMRKPIRYSARVTLSNNRAISYLAGDKTKGIIESSGILDLKNQFSRSEVSFHKMDITALQPYITPYFNLAVQRGYLSGTGKAVHYWGADKYNYQGSLQISDFSTTDSHSNEPLFSWQNMAIDHISYNETSNVVKVDKIHFERPYAKIIIHKNRTTNIGEIKVKSETNSQLSIAQILHQRRLQKDKLLQLAINKITLHDGSAYFSDHSLRPSFSSAIRSIDGSISAFNSTGDTPARVQVQGKLDQYAPIHLSGQVNPLLEHPYLNLLMDIQSAELTSLNTYSGVYAGYYIDKGQMSLSVRYILDKGKLRGSNHVYIDQLELGKPSDSSLATTLPVKLAIALLQDSDGVIDLGVQVTGNVDDPHFGFGNLVWKAFKNVVTKAVKAPFSMLANLIGSDEELDRIAFAAGQTDIEPKQQKTLTALAKALRKRPKLKLDIQGSVNPNQDALAIAEQRIKQRLAAMGVKNAPSLSASYISANKQARHAIEKLYAQKIKKSVYQQKKALRKRMQAGTGKSVDNKDLNVRLYASLYHQLLNSEPVAVDSLHQMAVDRARHVKSYLVNQLHIDPTRVFLLSANQAKSHKSEVLVTLNTN